MEYIRNFFGFLNCYVIYFVMQLGRCVLSSIIVLAFVLILRSTVLRKTIFLKGTIWFIFFLVPFTGKMKLFYENKLIVKLFGFWHNFCIEYYKICYLYLFGIIVSGIIIFYKRKKLKNFIAKMQKAEIYHQKIIISDIMITPFTTGFFHSKIVIPRKMIENFPKEELQLIILHEKVHIYLKHFFCYFLWDILRILLWINPFLTFCMKYFKEDLEDVCDRITIQKSGKDAYQYGNLLLKSILFLQKGSIGFSPTFTGEKEYKEIKRRFIKVADFQPYKKLWTIGLCIGSFIVFFSAFFFIKKNSYPIYTRDTSIAIVNAMAENVKIYDEREIKKAILIDEKNIYIHRTMLDKILKKDNIELEAFYLGFGGYIKTPGMGGGVICIYIDYSGKEENLIIPYKENRNILDMIFKII